jgi:hypothetical protein
MSEELRPCPFCGGVPDPLLGGPESCTNDRCGCVFLGHYNTTWNTRPVEDAQAQRIARLERVLRAVDARVADADTIYEDNWPWGDVEYKRLYSFEQIRRVIAAAVGGDV